MGLDMYAFSTNAKPKTDVDFETKNFKPEEVHYWRKHPNLHGWMQSLYDAKGGTESNFNGDCVVKRQACEGLPFFVACGYGLSLSDACCFQPGHLPDAIPLLESPFFLTNPQHLIDLS